VRKFSFQIDCPLGIASELLARDMPESVRAVFECWTQATAITTLSIANAGEDEELSQAREATIAPITDAGKIDDHE
jgi:hypothetical protein